MPVPHELTIDVLDGFGAVVGTATVTWADVQWSAGAIDEVHRAFSVPVRLAIPPDPRQDSRVIWSLAARMDLWRSPRSRSIPA